MEMGVYTSQLNPAIASAPELFLYGAGKNAINLLTRMTLQNIHGKVLGITDSNPEKWDSKLYGIPVISPYEMQKRSPRASVIVTPDAYWFAIQKALHDLGFYNIYYFSEAALPIIRLGKIRSEQSAQHRMLFEKHSKKIDMVRAWFHDDKSRAVFDAYLRSWIHGEHFLPEALVEKDQYYPKDIISLTDNEVFVDCGTLDGGTVVDFVRRAGAYKYIYAFEPHPGFYEITKAFLESNKIEHCELFKLGVYSHTGTQEFSEEAYSILQTDKSTVIQVDSLDNVLYEKPDRPTFIKMDIEGAELEALSGADKIITRDRPKLAISAYHVFEHLFEIPYLLKTKYPDYDIYLRQHANITETICYAV